MHLVITLTSMRYFIDEYKRHGDKGQILSVFQVVDDHGTQYKTFDKYSSAEKLAHELADSPDDVEYRDREFDE